MEHRLKAIRKSPRLFLIACLTLGRQIVFHFIGSMNSNKRSITSLLNDIGCNLNPTFCYLVFEKAIQTSESEEFTEIRRILSKLQIKNLQLKKYRGKGSTKAILIVKIEKKYSDTIMQEIFAAVLPPDVNCYFYKNIAKK